MQQDHLALSTIPAQPAADSDYDTICAAIMATARGRWFLEEFARRNRNADITVVLAAIQRIEAAVRDTNAREAHQSIRADLLEMARTIAATRAEIAGIKPEGGASAADAAPAAQSGVLAAAERIQDVVWAMRERGLDPATCDQIDALATAVLSASALRDPNDHRSRKLGEVLQYLERRIARMLDMRKTEDTGAPPHRPETSDAATSAPACPPAGATHAREPLVVIPFPVCVADAAPVDLALDPIVINPEPAAERPGDAATFEDALFAPAWPQSPVQAAGAPAMAAAPSVPQPGADDPLAALEAMSPEQRIALFS